jgi:hypothetical protein
MFFRHHQEGNIENIFIFAFLMKKRKILYQSQ